MQPIYYYRTIVSRENCCQKGDETDPYLLLVDNRVKPFEVRESVINLPRPAAAVEEERQAREGSDRLFHLMFVHVFISMDDDWGGHWSSFC